jgi:hypothetical protein
MKLEAQGLDRGVMELLLRECWSTPVAIRTRSLPGPSVKQLRGRSTDRMDVPLMDRDLAPLTRRVQAQCDDVGGSKRAMASVRVNECQRGLVSQLHYPHAHGWRVAIGPQGQVRVSMVGSGLDRSRRH